MDEFKVIEIMNETMIEVKKETNKDYEINLKIKQDLQNETFFFKIDKEKAFEILKNVGVKQDQLEYVYKKLTSPNTYYDLVYKGKIKPDDETLVVKYKKFESDNLF